MQDPSWEANSFSASQEIPRISCNPKAHYHIHKSPSPVPILSQINPFHSTSWWTILILSFNLCLGLSTFYLPSDLPTKTPNAPLLSHIRATCPAHFILLNFITQILFGVKYRSQNYMLCSLLHSPVTSSLLGPNIFPSTPFSIHPQPSFLPQYEWLGFTTIQNNRKI